MFDMLDSDAVKPLMIVELKENGFHCHSGSWMS